MDRPATDVGETHDPVSTLRVAGERLVEALRDQVADGQVETLHSLHTAATILQRQAAALADAVTVLTTGVQDEVSDGFERLLQETLAGIGERLADEVDETTASLTRSAEKVARQIGSTEKALRKVTDLSAERAEQARAALEAAAAELAAHAVRADEALGRSGTTLEARMRAVALEAEERIATATDEAVQVLRMVAEQTRVQLDAARKAGDEALDAHLAALKTQLASQVRRDATIAARLQQQVEALIERTDATAGRTVELLQQALADLDGRDRALEQERAEAFVRALHELLPHERAKRLRGAVRDGLTARTRRASDDNPGEQP